MFFFNRISASSTTQLWCTDENSSNSFILESWVDGVSFQRKPVIFNDILYFVGFDSGGISIFKSDGSIIGTNKLKEDLTLYYVKHLIVCGNKLYFTNNYLNPIDEKFNELWQTDGTSDGTILTDFAQNSNWIGNIECFQNNLFYFYDSYPFFPDNHFNVEYGRYKVLKKTNGNIITTHNLIVSNSQQFINNYGAYDMYATDSKLYFLANNGYSGYELFGSNSEALLSSDDFNNQISFDEFVKQLQPQIVLFDRYISEEQFGWRVAENCPNALRILDTEDLHFLRLARQEAFKKNIPFDEFDLHTDVAKREIASIYRCDVSLMISEVEIQLLQEQFNVPKSLLFYLPFLISELPQKVKSFEERTDLVFIGNFLHEPNWNAVQYLKQTLWPIMAKQLPQAQLKIYGAYPSQKVLQLHQPKDHFLVLGRAENALEVIEDAKILLAPLRFGAGAKGKLIEAMITGTPSVTTTIGAESMHNNLPWNGTITDNEQAFVNAAVELYTNPMAWNTAQQNGFKIIQKRYLKSLFENDFKTQIETLLQHLTAHRKSNFIGNLLQHHLLTSTKYMSKWIEEKNKCN